MKKQVLLIAFATSLIVSCATSRLTSVLSIQEMPVPPGTKKIAENLYIDQAEIRNLDYLEYLHWTETVFGTSSEEYKQAIPELKLWGNAGARYAPLDSSYSKQKENRLLGVLGVSNKQAKLFSKWRSDRVMEFILLNRKVLKWNPAPTKETAFTIEKYFTGNYLNLQPNPNMMYYPVYSLLDSTQNTEAGFKTICVYKKWERK